MKRFHLASFMLCLGLLAGTAYGDEKLNRDDKACADKNAGKVGLNGCENWGECASRDAIKGDLKEGTLKLSLERVRRVQHALVARGFTIEVIDGSVNSSTETALELFQKEFGLKQTGKIDFATLNALGFDVAVMIKNDVKGSELIRVEMERARAGATPGMDGSRQGAGVGASVGVGASGGSTARRPIAPGTDIDPATGRPYDTARIDPATGRPYDTARIDPATGLPYDDRRAIEGTAGRPIEGVTELPAGMPIDVNMIGSNGNRAIGYVVLGTEAIKSIQKFLNGEKLYAGTPSGVVNPEFVNAVRAFQRSRGIQPRGFLDIQTLAAMTDVDIKVEPTNRMDPYLEQKHGAVAPKGPDGNLAPEERPVTPVDGRDAEYPRKK